MKPIDQIGIIRRMQGKKLTDEQAREIAEAANKDAEPFDGEEHAYRWALSAFRRKQALT